MFALCNEKTNSDGRSTHTTYCTLPHSTEAQVTVPLVLVVLHPEKHQDPVFTSPCSRSRIIVQYLKLEMSVRSCDPLPAAYRIIQPRQRQDHRTALMIRDIFQIFRRGSWWESQTVKRMSKLHPYPCPTSYKTCMDNNLGHC